MPSFGAFSLRAKLTLVTMVSSSVALLVAFLAFGVYDRMTSRDTLVAELSTIAQMVGEHANVAMVLGRGDIADEVLEVLREWTIIGHAYILDADGEPFASFDRDGSPQQQPGIEGIRDAHRFEPDRLLLSREIDYETESVGSIIIDADLDQLYTRGRRYAFIVVGLFSLSLLIAFGLGRRMQRIISGPILNLAAMMGVMSQDSDLSVRAERDDADEIGALYTGFNELLDQLQAREGERDQATLAMRESEKKYRNLFEVAPFALVVVNQKGEMIIVNSRAMTLFGYSESELLGQRVEMLIPSNHRGGHVSHRSDYAQRPVERHMGAMLDLSALHKDGRLIPVEIALSPIRTGNETRVLTLIVDITERRRVEASLRQAQKLEAIGTLAGGVAHEINNPLNGILNYAQLISDRLEEKHPSREFAEEIINETGRVASIVRNLLQFSRHEEWGRSEAKIDDIVGETVSLVRTLIARDQVTLDVEIADDLPAIQCSRQQIRQVLMNLFINARDALNERYPEYDPNKIMRVTAHSFETDGRQWLRTTVEDRGAGISEAISDRVFDPFFTTKDRATGTGLGLSVSHGIIKDHHGELSFECLPGQGTQFHLDLPVTNGLHASDDDPTEEI